MRRKRPLTTGRDTVLRPAAAAAQACADDDQRPSHTDAGDHTMVVAHVTAHDALTESVRRLIDATIRTEVDAAAIEAAAAKIDSATAQLSEALMPGSFGVQRAPDGRSIALGNVVIGLRNPVAPPLVIHHGAGGVVHTDFVLGAAYEGPPGHVHGGVCALILDHVLGATAHRPGEPAVTGTLTLRYVRGTSLGRPLRAQARVDRIDGAKTFAVGDIADENGVTVQAEGVFIHPRQPQR